MLQGSKPVIRILLLILVLSAAFLFFFPMKNSKPLLSLDKLTMPNLSDIKLPEVNLPNLSGDSPSGQVTVYKWQDASGNWHFSNEPPPDNTPYQTTKVDPNANLIHSEAAAPTEYQKTGPYSPVSNGNRETNEALEKLSDMIEPTRKAKNALRQHEQEELEKTE